MLKNMEYLYWEAVQVVDQYQISVSLVSKLLIY
jgi:hypothetical protein